LAVPGSARRRQCLAAQNSRVQTGSSWVSGLLVGARLCIAKHGARPRKKTKQRHALLGKMPQLCPKLSVRDVPPSFSVPTSTMARSGSGFTVVRLPWWWASPAACPWPVLISISTSRGPLNAGSSTQCCPRPCTPGQHKSHMRGEALYARSAQVHTCVVRPAHHRSAQVHTCVVRSCMPGQHTRQEFARGGVGRAQRGWSQSGAAMSQTACTWER